MQLPHPNPNQPFTSFLDKKDNDGKVVHEYGVRNVEGQEEIVNLETGLSNMKFWQPESVLNPEGCKHEFLITDMGKREAECQNCHVPTSFVLGHSLIEKDGKALIQYQKKWFPITSL